MPRICPSCGATVNDDSQFCVRCGSSMSAPQMNTGKNYTSSTGAKGFVNSQESGSFSLKNGMAMNVLSGEGFVKEDAIITNRRLYYSASSGIINKNSLEAIVDIADITGTKITDYNPYALFIAAALEFLGCVIGIRGANGFLFGLIGALVFVALFYITKKSHLKIEYAGGSISFSVKKYGLKNVREFQRQIYAEKEKMRESLK